MELGENKLENLKNILNLQFTISFWIILLVILLLLILRILIKNNNIIINIASIILFIFLLSNIINLYYKPKENLPNINITNIMNIIISIGLLFVTANLYNYQNKILRKENTPYPYLSSILVNTPTLEEIEHRNIRNPTNSKGEPVATWYYYGRQEAQYLGKNIEEIGIKLNDTNPEDIKIINEIRNNEGSVCFSKINDHNCILFINEDIKSSFILEYCGSVINIKNYGSSCHNCQLESIKIFFNSAHNNLELTLTSKNTNQKTIPLVAESGDTIQLVFCQVTHNLINSQCIISEKIINELGNSYDLLTKRMPDNSLNYDKAEIIMSCENFLNETFCYKLIFEKQGYYYISKTELLNTTKK